MKTIIVTVLFIISIASAAVSEETVLPEDAELISNLIFEIEDFEPLVNIAVDDSCLVIFIVTGRDWTVSEENWDELASILAIASGVDYERYWQARDVVVSYTKIWFEITMPDLFWLSENVETITEDEWWEELKDRTAVYEYQANANECEGTE